MTFREKEKERYRKLKSSLFSRSAQREGTYRGRPHDFCLADDCASENLYETVRGPAIAYFEARGIPWHDGGKKGRIPSNHLCCSQSCCVNFLYPMRSNRNLVARVFKCFYPELVEPLPIDQDCALPNDWSPYMAFEWIGTKDYLGEHLRKPGVRTRGANYTSADFTFRFQRQDGRIQVVIGEWKYTEYYGAKDLGRPSNDKDKKPEARKRNYAPAFNRDKGIFAGRGEDLYDALFFEPFYQLMRQQLLAQEMEVGREMAADVVSVLHICPEANREFEERVTSRELRRMFPGKGTVEIWKELVAKDEFMSVAVEEFRDTISREVGSDDRKWADYLNVRYGWDRND